MDFKVDGKHAIDFAKNDAEKAAMFLLGDVTDVLQKAVEVELGGEKVNMAGLCVLLESMLIGYISKVCNNENPVIKLCLDHCNGLLAKIINKSLMANMDKIPQ